MPLWGILPHRGASLLIHQIFLSIVNQLFFHFSLIIQIDISCDNNPSASIFAEERFPTGSC